ncbi:isocitrate lyase/phosphoenolpyruvate mutase family protein [Streptomyces sp. NPDC005481]|uniref:isocitrate lyase/PEP mutase family protein n=1 Tax=Streptomyces sp. NPDC005481 TaxID=3154881 RepID=UPI0033B2ECB3
MTHHDTSALHASAVAFRALHVPGRPLVLPNAWDTVSALLVEDAGAAALATTSAGIAWELGAADGNRLDRGQALAAVERIAARVRIPVTADIESGYADDAEGVKDTVRAVLAAGAVGMNIEDALHDGEGRLRPVDEQAGRIAAARAAADEAGVPLFVNARTDTFLSGGGSVEETLERAAVFVAAGADGVFVPGAADPAVVKALVEGIDAPLNVMVGPWMPAGVPELAALGVARVSAGAAVAQAAHALVRRAARELLGTGTYETLADGLDYGELNSLIGGGR